MQIKINTAFILIFMILFANSIFSQGYYKDIFMDGGIGLRSRQNLPAQAYLNLSMEFIATEDISIQNSLMVYNSNDENGVLLSRQKSYSSVF